MPANTFWLLYSWTDESCEATAQFFPGAYYSTQPLRIARHIGVVIVACVLAIRSQISLKRVAVETAPR